ncbi:hypothetical protein M9Y10_008775 [Tritrichomonas musculus]|uniref:Protein kinase domain-containing protein n=1 Tax=Tritrichomonas musculus TaxID=1915356 RepID=A0ABR2J0Y5_9EUKA
MDCSKISRKYQIIISDFKIISEIKRGGFGIVYLVENIKTNERYAAKVNLIDNGESTVNRKLFVSREVQILMRIQHPTVIQFQGFSFTDFNNNENITIFMNYMQNGSLADLINKGQHGLLPHNFDNTQKQIILAGIARGMMALHNSHIIHRDLKPENILLDQNYHPRITDFGLSKFFDPHNSMSQSMTDTGTATYMAPEVIMSNHYNTKADVYAFGIIMYEVISGTRAYMNYFQKKGFTIFKLKMKINEGLRPIFNFPIKKQLKKLIESCWSKNPSQRPTFSELYTKLSLSSTCAHNEETNPESDEEEEEESNEFCDTSFCLENVDLGTFFDYIDTINFDPEPALKRGNNDQNTKEIQKQMDLMKSAILSLHETVQSQEREIASLKERHKSEVDFLNRTIKNQEMQIEMLRKSQQAQSNNFSDFFICKESFTDAGILHQLKMKEQSPFNPLFVASQSSNDLYSLLLPDDNDTFLTANVPNFFINFELKEVMTIYALKIVSSKVYFPKSFDIEIDGKTVLSVREARELNGKGKEMIVSFGQVKGRNVRIILTDKNWDKNDHFIAISHVELLSNDVKYSKGVFAKLVEMSKNNDPHNCGVVISSSYFDFNSFFLLNSKSCTWTFNDKNPWFQIELISGLAVIHSFRLNKNPNRPLKSYRIVASDDPKKPVHSWLILFEISELSINEHKILDVYQLEKPSPPIRAIRMVQTSPNWGNDLFLSFLHLDFFGYYL